MDFTPTDTQRMLGDSVSSFLAGRHDPATRQKRLQAKITHDAAFWQELASLGLTGIEIPEGHGGSGGSFGDLAVVLEEIGAALVTEPFIATVVLAASLIRDLGSPEQQAQWLPAIAAGTLKASLAHAERQARGTLNWVSATAVPTAEGWRLDGAKSVVLGGDAADLLLVSARTHGDVDDVSGISLFAVPADAAGLGGRRYSLYDGSGAADLVLDGVLLPHTALVGKAGEAIAAIERAHDRGAAAVCVEAVGAMGRLHALTVDYAKTRRQFGQPIGSFQALQHRMVDMTISAEQARSITYLACAKVDAATRGGVDAAERRRVVSAAKVKVADAARHVGQEAIQLHGGMGMTQEMKVAHTFKRLTMIAQQFGDAEHHLERFAAAG